MFTALMNFAL